MEELPKIVPAIHALNLTECERAFIDAWLGNTSTRWLVNLNVLMHAPHTLHIFKRPRHAREFVLIVLWSVLDPASRAYLEPEYYERGR